MKTVSALLDRGEKPVARGVGIDGLVQDHPLEAVQQEAHGAERMRGSGQELVRDGDEDRRPTLFRDAVGHRRESSSHEREEASAHDHRQERRVQQGFHHDPLAGLAVQQAHHAQALGVAVNAPAIAPPREAHLDLDVQDLPLHARDDVAQSLADQRDRPAPVDSVDRDRSSGPRCLQAGEEVPAVPPDAREGC